MNIIVTEPTSSNDKFRQATRARREHHAQRATAIDAERFPIISRHWPGLLIVNGQLCRNYDPNFKVGAHE